MRYPAEVESLVEEVHGLLREGSVGLAVAESCTGGLLGGAVTAVPGSSDVFQGGILAYSNQMKRKHLGVAKESLLEEGAVSETVAREMVRGLREIVGVACGVSVTGIAGPEGGSEEKPVGLVYTGVSADNETIVDRSVFDGDRATVRRDTVRNALELLRDQLKST